MNMDTQLLGKCIEKANLSGVLAVAVVGSSTLPYIINPRDIDVCVYINPTVERRTRYVAGLRAALKTDVNPNISLITRAPVNWWETGGLLKTHAFLNLPRFAVNVIGNISEMVPPEEVDVFANKDKYIESLKRYWLGEDVEEHIRKYGRLKSLYQALLVVYFLDNNSYELTDEQKKNVNIAHDCADGWEELHEWLTNRLKEC
jgi:hypothetical protein